MNEKMCDLMVGALLHDFGKLLYRYNDGRNHSQSGYEYLKENVGLKDEILNQVRYHHKKLLSAAKVPNDSLAYITYISDNIAAAADRRKADTEGTGFVRELAQHSIFNLLNGHSDTTMSYSPMMLTGDINYPSDGEIKFNAQFYGECVRNITDCMKAIEPTAQYINSLLEIMEANISYVPSSTSLGEVADISLFDHCKMTAAIASSIFEYLNEKNEADYHKVLFYNEQNFYDEKAFLLYSLDISGIQDFIYNITSEGALKALRSRSFYLELLMESMIDDLLENLGLSRVNLIYSGGGHAYIIMGGTDKNQRVLAEFEKNINDWFMQNSKTALYVSGGYVLCSANDLKNEQEGSYKNLFREISNRISSKKSHRYTAQEIIALNSYKADETERECSGCFRAENLRDSGRCSLCEALIAFSKDVQKGDFYTVVSECPSEPHLPLPNGRYLLTDTENSLRRRMKEPTYLRSYSKNEMYSGQNLACSIWVGDYQFGHDFHDFTTNSSGIERLGVIRADIDDLGKAFVQGFENEKDKDYYVTLSRTSTFSRKLSLFFKRHINGILENGVCFLTNEHKDGKRKASIVYSGGDDLFVVGEWADIIGFAVDLDNEVQKFTQGKLTLSAGIAIFPEKHPVASMARQTGELEEVAKSHPGKNAVAIFDENSVYSWEEFISEVLGEKYSVIRGFFNTLPEYGKSFLYKLLDFLRNKEEKINIARYAYLLARMQPDDKASDETKRLYEQFASKMYEWMKREKDTKQAITALYIYVYTIREEGDTYETR